MKRSPLPLCARAVFLELWRRQDAWILLLLMGLFSAVALSARLAGLDTPAAATFMLNLGLSLAGIFAHLLTLLIAVRQFPDEIENRTLYPLLAKPLRRETLVLGKLLACAAGGLLVYALFAALAWAATPRLESYEAATLAQHLALQPFSLAATAAIGLAAGLALPRGVSLLTALLLVFAGERLHQFLAPHSLLANLLPRFGALNLVTRYTDGIGPLGAAGWLALWAYALCWLLGASWLAVGLFRRRAL